jgi:hypothetical protein
MKFLAPQVSRRGDSPGNIFLAPRARPPSIFGDKLRAQKAAN